MRTGARGVLAAALLAAGAVGVLSACSDRATVEQPSGLPITTNPTDPVPDVSGDRGPLGLEIRYLDAHGKVVVLEPKDFPR